MKQTFKNAALGEEYDVYTHESGLKIYTLRKSGYSSCYAIFGTAYGSVDTCFSVGRDPITVPEGIAHFLEHKLFESEELDAFELFSKTGADANAYTSFDRTCYLFNCTANWKKNLEILLGFVSSPYFTAQTVQKEQGIIGQEIQMYEDDPDWRVLFNLLCALYHNNPVKIEIAGTRQSIAKITDKLLYDCYNAFYNPQNMFLCIVGDIDGDEVFDVVCKNLKPRPAVDLKRHAKAEPDTIVKPYTEQALSVAKPLFMIGFKDKSDTDYQTLKRSIAVELLLDTLFSIASPLYIRLNEKGLLSQPFDCEYFDTRNTAVSLIGGESDDPKAVFEEVKKEVERVKAEGIDRELFDAAKRGRYGVRLQGFDRVENICGALCECAVRGTGLFESAEILKSITAEEAEKALDAFCADKCALSVIVPQKGDAKQ